MHFIEKDRTRLSYRSQPIDGHFIEVSLYYSKGRGIYLSIMPIERKSSGGFVTESYIVCSGSGAVKLVDLARSNPKFLRSVAAQINDVTPIMTAHLDHSKSSDEFTAAVMSIREYYLNSFAKPAPALEVAHVQA